MWQGILIIALFVAVIALLVARKIPTLVALPLMAIGIVIIAGVPPVGTDSAGNEVGFLATVVEAGTVYLAATIMAVIFGSWLGQMLSRTGVTETLIKKAGELGGDRPLAATLLLSLVVAGLFSVLNGLGAVIMVGTIVLPIFLSIGIPALSAACIFMMSFGTGMGLNMVNWQLHATIFDLPMAVVRNFEVALAGVSLLATIALILIQFKRDGIKYGFAAPSPVSADARPTLSGRRAPLAMITPVIPIVLVAVFEIPVVSAFIISLLWITVFTATNFKKTINTFTQTCYDGITDGGPAIILMVGIGMLIKAVQHDRVAGVLGPLVSAVTPTSALTFALFFILLVPLALYRGPLQMMGLGGGVAGLMVASGALPVAALMGGFVAMDRVSQPGDPTNTMNVWTANYVGCEVIAITKRIMPYIWCVAALGVGYAVLRFF